VTATGGLRFDDGAPVHARPAQRPTTIDAMTETVVGNVPDDCTQVIVVYADSFESTDGVLFCYERESKDSLWVERAGSDKGDGLLVYLGEGAIGGAGDNSFETPIGSFPLGVAFGHEPNFGCDMDYFEAVDGVDFWDSGFEYWFDDYSQNLPTTYNTHITKDEIRPPKDGVTHEVESLGTEPAYDYAVFVDHNPSRRPGWGCAIFLHCKEDDDDDSDTDQLTEGCIAADSTLMRWILQWLRKARHPHLSVITGLDE